MQSANINSAVAEEIMTPHVIMLDTSASFEDVIKIIKENNISAIFLKDSLKNDYYIISQTDVLRFLYEEGLYQENIANVPATRLMRGPVEMYDVETPIDKIIRIMAEYRYKRILISREGKPAGVVSTRDIMIWNNTYFKQAKPQILLFMDNFNSTFIAQHIFQDNINDHIEHELIDIYGGALTSISMITNEIIKDSGGMRNILKDKRSILFEPFKGITGILICDHNSIELRRKLQVATLNFYKEHQKIIDLRHANNQGIHSMLKIDPIIPIFKPSS